jgi:hypothetical protein
MLWNECNKLLQCPPPPRSTSAQLRRQPWSVVKECREILRNNSLIMAYQKVMGEKKLNTKRIWETNEAELVINAPLSYETRRFITMFTRTRHRHLTLSWARLIQSGLSQVSPPNPTYFILPHTCHIPGPSHPASAFSILEYSYGTVLCIYRLDYLGSNSGTDGFVLATPSRPAIAAVANHSDLTDH